MCRWMLRLRLGLGLGLRVEPMIATTLYPVKVVIGRGCGWDVRVRVRGGCWEGGWWRQQVIDGVVAATEVGVEGRACGGAAAAASAGGGRLGRSRSRCSSGGRGRGCGSAKESVHFCRSCVVEIIKGGGGGSSSGRSGGCSGECRRRRSSMW